MLDLDYNNNKIVVSAYQANLIKTMLSMNSFNNYQKKHSNQNEKQINKK